MWLQLKHFTSMSLACADTQTANICVTVLSILLSFTSPWLLTPTQPFHLPTTFSQVFLCLCNNYTFVIKMFCFGIFKMMQRMFISPWIILLTVRVQLIVDSLTRSYMTTFHCASRISHRSSKCMFDVALV